ncbi:MAG: hypothetical protein POELPBGB_00210 [Bacteroidia bacterium]|nr:hypothetical protein [Bacteroidia bacterium]
MKKCIHTLLFAAILFSKSAVAQTSVVDHWETVVYASDTWRYFRGVSQPSSTWRNINYNHNAWNQGPCSVGYGDGDDATTISATVSLYLRKNFTILDTANIEQAILNMDYDDGFIAWINGIEVARSSTMGFPGDNYSYNTGASGMHEAIMYQGGDPEYYPISKSVLNTCLLPGNNVLAIQVQNESINSSDLTSLPWLTLGLLDNGTYYGTPPSWFDAPFSFASSDLPIVVINTNGGTIVDAPRIVVDMGIIYNGPGQRNYLTDPFNNYDGKVNIEIRGSSSQGFPQKQYGFETQDDLGNNLNVSLLNFPQENDWVLHALYGEKSLLRNYFAYNLSREMGWYATRTQHCEVVLDGVYQGLYMLEEQIKWDGERVDIEEVDSLDNAGDSLTGGYIFKVDKLTGSSGLGWNSPVTDFQGQVKDTYFQYDYPKPSDITPEQEAYIQNAMTEFELALLSDDFQNPDSGYHKYADVASFIDFFFINEITKNVDGYRLSTYLNKQRDSRGGRIAMGPVWDFNLGFGNADYCAGESFTGWALDFPCDQSVIPFWWQRMMQDTSYLNQLNCRWLELRSDILHTDSLMMRIDTMAIYLNESQQRHYQTWPILGTYVWPNYFVGNTYQEEVDYLKYWITERLNWMDANMPGSSSHCASYFSPQVTISEINYRSSNEQNAGDWYELHNSGNTPVDVSNWFVRDGNLFNTFTIPAGTIIQPDGYLVVSQDTTLFLQQHSLVTDYSGQLNWGLGNGGDRIHVYDAYHNPVFSMNYDDVNPWTTLADGGGYTLERYADSTSLSSGNTWFAGCPEGSPGIAFVPWCVVSAEENVDNYQFSIYPNPFGSQVNISYNSDRADKVYIEIMDANARTVSSYNYIQNVGTNTISWNGKTEQGNALSAGIFLIKISDEQNNLFTAKIIKQ